LQSRHNEKTISGVVPNRNVKTGWGDVRAQLYPFLEEKQPVENKSRKVKPEDIQNRIYPPEK